MGHPVTLEQTARCSLRALVHEREQQVLDGDVFVLQPLGLLLGEVEHAGKALGDVDLPGRGAGAAHPGTPFQLVLQLQA